VAKRQDRRTTKDHRRLAVINK